MTETERLLIELADIAENPGAVSYNAMEGAIATIRRLTAERDALRKHADALAGALVVATDGWDDEAKRQVGALSALAAYTAYLIDGGNG